MTERDRSERPNVEYDPEARRDMDAAQAAFQQKLVSGTLTPDDTRALLEAVDRFAERVGWNHPEVREAVAAGRYRAPGFVVVDEVGYDRDLARRSVGKGWHALIDEVFDHRDRVYPAGRIVQVKEKMGWLAVYFDGPDEGSSDFGDFLFEVLVRSMEVCEECGAPGAPRQGAWIKTLCDAHAAGRPVSPYPSSISVRASAERRGGDPAAEGGDRGSGPS